MVKCGRIPEHLSTFVGVPSLITYKVFFCYWFNKPGQSVKLCHITHLAKKKKKKSVFFSSQKKLISDISPSSQKKKKKLFTWKLKWWFPFNFHSIKVCHKIFFLKIIKRPEPLNSRFEKERQ